MRSQARTSWVAPIVSSNRQSMNTNLDPTEDINQLFCPLLSTVKTVYFRYVSHLSMRFFTRAASFDNMTSRNNQFDFIFHVIKYLGLVLVLLWNGISLMTALQHWKKPSYTDDKNICESTHHKLRDFFIIFQRQATAWHYDNFDNLWSMRPTGKKDHWISN